MQVVATVTRDSRRTLDLEVGTAAFALVNAAGIIVATQTRGVRFSTRQKVPGKVVRVVPGAIDSEVVMRAVGGIDVVAVVTNDSLAWMKLVAGSTADTLFEASSVVVGVAV